jgi:hypothetical protein
MHAPPVLFPERAAYQCSTFAGASLTSVVLLRSENGFLAVCDKNWLVIPAGNLPARTPPRGLNGYVLNTLVPNVWIYMNCYTRCGLRVAVRDCETFRMGGFAFHNKCPPHSFTIFPLRLPRS